jgi:LacI family transcriptional regulator
MATGYLLDLGHRRILHLSGPAGSGAAQDRRAGYEAALRERGADVRPDWIVPFTESDEDARRIAGILCGPDRPTAAFTWSDDEAVRLLTCARGLGLRVPGDFSLVGFDSTDMCNHVVPPLTSIRQPIYDMTTLAFELLARKIKGVRVESPRVLFAPELIVRSSCGPAPDGRPNHRR